MDTNDAKPVETPAAPAGPSPTDAFLTRVDEDMQAHLKAEKTRVAFTAILLVFVVCYMSFMFVKLGEANAETLTKRAGEFFEESLPDWEADLKEFAMAEAPKLVADGRKMVLEAPRNMRVDLQNKLADTTKESITQMKQEMAPKLRLIIKEHAGQLQDKSQADHATPDDALRIVTEALVKDFREKSQLYMKTHYGDFLIAIRDLNKRLERLRTHQHLEADERLQREIVAATVVLVHKYHPINDESKIRTMWSGMKREGDGN